MSLRQLPRYRGGQVFEGTAFGQAVTVRLSYPTWVEESSDPFWSWTCRMLPPHGGEATICEDVLATEYREVVHAS